MLKKDLRSFASIAKSQSAAFAVRQRSRIVILTMFEEKWGLLLRAE